MFYSLALDESTGQLAISVLGVDRNFDIFEEILSIASLKDRTTGEDVFKALLKVMEFNNLHFQNYASVATDGAPRMIGQYIGLVVFKKAR